MTARALSFPVAGEGVLVHGEPGAVWLHVGKTSTVHRYDPATGRETAALSLPPTAGGLSRVISRVGESWFSDEHSAYAAYDDAGKEIWRRKRDGEWHLAARLGSSLLLKRYAPNQIVHLDLRTGDLGAPANVELDSDVYHGAVAWRGTTVLIAEGGELVSIVRASNEIAWRKSIDAARGANEVRGAVLCGDVIWIPIERESRGGPVTVLAGFDAESGERRGEEQLDDAWTWWEPCDDFLMAIGARGRSALAWGPNRGIARLDTPHDVLGSLHTGEGWAAFSVRDVHAIVRPVEGGKLAWTTLSLPEGRAIPAGDRLCTQGLRRIIALDVSSIGHGESTDVEVRSLPNLPPPPSAEGVTPAKVTFVGKVTKTATLQHPHLGRIVIGFDPERDAELAIGDDVAIEEFERRSGGDISVNRWRSLSRPNPPPAQPPEIEILPPPEMRPRKKTRASQLSALEAMAREDRFEIPALVRSIAKRWDEDDVFRDRCERADLFVDTSHIDFDVPGEEWLRPFLRDGNAYYTWGFFVHPDRSASLPIAVWVSDDATVEWGAASAEELLRSRLFAAREESPGIVAQLLEDLSLAEDFPRAALSPPPAWFLRLVEG